MPMRGIWNVSHFRDNTSAVRDAAGARSAAREARDHAADLEERLDKLSLICMAMWELLRDRAKMSESDLLAKVQELDLRDGEPDGKVTRKVADCPQCHRTMSPRHQRCLYCGHERLVRSAFDAL